MAGAIGGSVAQPIVSNRIEERLGDPLELGQATRAQRSDETKAEGQSDKDVADFGDYLNQSGITLLSRAQETNRFDPVEEIGRGSVYGMPADKQQI
ncbi:hypothetical protein [Aureimonas sp. AU4]|uniref:hypothetical protein n=1 Tax=Aureimonas sp. AU4 TaxID=1638163 RepID=UPI000783C558|nr:hypothetical protein [Aureimonas sp. AU4]